MIFLILILKVWIMKTIKPVSTVSWNTEEFLLKTLNKLVANHTVLFWFYVKHFAESDEKKEHIHLYIEPDIRIDTNELRSNFEEIPQKDCECKDIIRPLPFTVSKFDTAYLYFTHNKLYLDSHGYSKQFYNYTDIVTSDEYLLHEKVALIDYYKLEGGKANQVKQAVLSGVSFEDMCLSGMIPVQQIKQYQLFYTILVSKYSKK